MSRLIIHTNRDGYNYEQCGPTMTVQELMELLEEFDPDSKIYLNFDNGYTFGSLTRYRIEEEFDEDNEYNPEGDE